MVEARSHDAPCCAGMGRAAGGGIVGGYNHQIPHRGRMYHVQTEDSGRRKCHIHTHVFHAGAIVASSRVDYDATARVGDVGALLKQSHRSMVRRLVRGGLDEAIGCLVGDAERRATEAPRAGPDTSAERSPEPSRARADEPETSLDDPPETLNMDNIKETLQDLHTSVAGVLGVALVDYESGMCLGAKGTGIDTDVAAAGNTDVMKAKMRVMRELGIEGGIEDILISLRSQYHIIRPVGSTLFLYLAVDRERGNLAMARHKLGAAAGCIAM